MACTISCNRASTGQCTRQAGTTRQRSLGKRLRRLPLGAPAQTGQPHLRLPCSNLKVLKASQMCVCNGLGGSAWERVIRGNDHLPRPILAGGAQRTWLDYEEYTSSVQASSTSTKSPAGSVCRDTLMSEYECPHSVAMNIAVAVLLSACIHCLLHLTGWHGGGAVAATAATSSSARGAHIAEPHLSPSHASRHPYLHRRLHCQLPGVRLGHVPGHRQACVQWHQACSAADARLVLWHRSTANSATQNQEPGGGSGSGSRQLVGQALHATNVTSLAMRS